MLRKRTNAKLFFGGIPAKTNEIGGIQYWRDKWLENYQNRKRCATSGESWIATQQLHSNLAISSYPELVAGVSECTKRRERAREESRCDKTCKLFISLWIHFVGVKNAAARTTDDRLRADTEKTKGIPILGVLCKKTEDALHAMQRREEKTRKSQSMQLHGWCKRVHISTCFSTITNRTYCHIKIHETIGELMHRCRRCFCWCRCRPPIAAGKIESQRTTKSI